MLIITRRIGEKLLIGDDVEIVVVDVQGNNVRIGINAPKEITIIRRELLNKNARKY